MTKKEIQILQEIKRKAQKVATLVRKIDESDKLGMSHRHDEYLQELDQTVEILVGHHKEIKKD